MFDENDRTICVILPIFDEKPLRTVYTRSSSGSTTSSIDHHIEFDTSIESTCFAKPLVVFTIKTLKRIQCIDTIILCSTSSRQEQIQEIISEYLPNYEGLKYLCASNAIAKNSHKHSNSAPHDITLNRLLKHCCSFLNETNDIVIVHDPNIPSISEKVIRDLSSEAFKHGAACLSSCENITNQLVKIDDSNIEDETQAESHNSKEIGTISGAIVSDFLDLNLRICLKPQAFKNSIFLIIFDNCTKEELDEDVDCLKLAKIHANIRVKLVFDREQVSNYPKNICCVQYYLKQTHKQAIIISKKTDQSVCFLQNILRFQKWNIEVRNSFEKETFIKINEMLDTQAVTDGIVLIKFCESINDLADFEFSFESSLESSTENQKNLKPFKRLLDESTCYVLFMIKLDSVSCPINTTVQSAIRSAIKQNMGLSKMWHISILYDTLSLNTTEFINYILTDRHESINGQIFECVN